MHVEDVTAFGHTIVGVSLGSCEYLRLKAVGEEEKDYFLELNDRSAYVLAGEARWNWMHGINRTVNGVKYRENDF